ncbi:ABC transporter substrate-binding protein [Microbacterium sp. CFBP9034]|uniref:ABC transporter substrate-binding protein n=1 Tax=Microbacterium sp. CFBP9034 TaxID=3096540 RepID=UPI002A6A765F|nr:ABC transporter substrate-binding protein [Microbacterium sp. CFBP9034]MDY0910204.1 ABC transporter substrate-binding protein [Microbacterium sp. CFBP9034]
MANKLTAARAAVAAALVGALALTGCASGAASSEAPESTEPAVLRWAALIPAHWDPVVQGSGFSFNLTALAYASLTEIDEEGNAAPGLAESWEYNDAGDAVTFHLRDGLEFQDGEPVDAEAVKLYLERAKTQENSALFGDLTSIDSVTADTELDVTVHLTQVDHQIPLLLGRRTAQITSPKAAEDPAKLDQWPVGAGPFTVVEYVPESHIYFEKNDDYWDAENIHIDRVELSAAPEPSTLVASISTGVYDFSYGLAAAQYDAAVEAGLDVAQHPVYSAANISLNTNKAPFDDPAVVDAVRHAIDRDEFLDKVTFGKGYTTTQPFPEGYIAYDEESADLWPYDPEKSREILADAGYEPGEIVVDFVVSAESVSNEIVQSQLAAIGITANIKVAPDWAGPFFAKDLTLSSYGTTGRESPVQTLTAHFGADGPLNLSSPSVPEGFEEAIAVARETPLDDPAYAENLRKATRLGLQSGALIFTVGNPTLIVKSPKVSDLPQIPGQIHLTGVTIEP